MSKHNKVNKSNYDQGGRLTPDDLAREYKKQAGVSSHGKGDVSSHGRGKERVTAKAPETPGGRGDSRPRSAPEE